MSDTAPTVIVTEADDTPAAPTIEERITALEYAVGLRREPTE